MKYFGVRLGTRNQLYFGSDPDLGFFLHLLVMCEISYLQKVIVISLLPYFIIIW